MRGRYSIEIVDSHQSLFSTDLYHASDISLPVMYFEKLNVGIYSSIIQACRTATVVISCFILFLVLSCTSIKSQMILGFGSCNKTHLDQSYWQVIDQEKLDAWIWLGDIVYADSDNPQVIERKFNQLKKNKNYEHFRNKNQIYGVWDDHDYGSNDGTKFFSAKDASRDILFDFLDVPKKHQSRNHKGAYQSYRISSNKISVRLILLDVRYFRDKLKKGYSDESRYIADDKADILGEDQWIWLGRELNNAEEDVILIGSGTQVIPQDHPFEKWSNFPTARDRLFQLIRNNADKKIILISGDRHMAEVSAVAILPNEFLYEITSSGLTHAWSDGGYEKNDFRIRQLIRQQNYGLLRIERSNNEVTISAQIKAIDGRLIDEYELYPQ